MTEVSTLGQTNGRATNGQVRSPQIELQKIYLKDASFEIPHAPQIFQELNQGEQPQVQLNLNHKSTELGDNLFEVVLGVTLTCTLGERTVYLVEVQQAGVFGMTGFESSDRDDVIGSYCPNLLFPYVRQMISSLVLEGGFPPFLLQPINFEALYAEQKRRASTSEESTLK